MGFLSWLNKIFGTDSSGNRQSGAKSAKGMNEGDFHSGPNGYSPNTAYPETFYGSQSSNDDGGATSNHNEGDFNR